MTTAQQLIDDNIVIENPDNTDEVIFNIPIRVKKVVIDSGGLEMFAEMRGWTPEIDGAPNPQSVTDKCKEMIVGYVRDTFEVAIERQVDAAGQLQKNAMKAQLL